MDIVGVYILLTAKSIAATHYTAEYTNAAVNNSSISCLMSFHSAVMSRCFKPKFKSA